MNERDTPAKVGSMEGLGVSVPKCACGDRAADACPGEWEQGCDLGANEAHVRAHTPTPEERAALTHALSLPPKAGSRWTAAGWPHGSVAKVLGVVEGWVVWRRKGCAPQLRHVNQWHDGFVPAIQVKPKKTPNVRANRANDGATGA
jgi:hypothetical protein